VAPRLILTYPILQRNIAANVIMMDHCTATSAPLFAVDMWYYPRRIGQCQMGMFPARNVTAVHSSSLLVFSDKGMQIIIGKCVLL
jgi:hypothetical protein